MSKDKASPSKKKSLKEIMKTKVEQFPVKNPNPVLSVGKDGIVLYSNEAGEPLLHEWSGVIGEKQVDTALHEGEELLPFVLETSHIGVWDLDLVDHTIHRSLEHDRIFGYKQLLPQWTYEMFLNHVLPEDRAMVDEKFRKATTERSDWSFECRIWRVDDKIRWIWAAGRHRSEVTGSVRRMAGIVQDITERKQAEEALQESEKRYRMLFNHSMDAIVLTDPRDGEKILSANPAACRMLRWSEEELIGKGRNVMFDLQDPALSTLLAERERSGSVRAQLTYRQKDGTTFAGEVSTASFTDSNGEPRTVSIIRDITERKKSEEILQKVHDSLEVKVRERTAELEAAYKSLKESERHLAEAQRMAHIGNWEWNILTDEVYWSAEMFRIFGRSPQESAPDYKEFLNYVHPEDRDSAYNAIKKGISGKTSSVVYRIVLANGEERVVYKQSEVILDGKNNPIRIRGIAQDITERKKSEEALANIETARKKEIHHRIKNNLQVISSLLDLQVEHFKNMECVKNSEILEAFRESQDRVISMALIHEELYKGNGFETLNFSPYIEELVESLFNTYRIGNSDISLKLDLEQNISYDMDTAVPLGIIVNELISNSLKHAFPDGKTGEIIIKLHREENGEQNNSLNKDCSITFILSVSDNGVGIAESLDIEDLDSLGLQLVTTLVNQLDGELELKRNNGTEFTIRFTVTEKDNQASAPALQLVDNE